MEEKKPYSFHAIQLHELRIAELSIQVDLSVPRDATVGAFSIESGRSDYDRESRQIQVRMSVLIGHDEQAQEQAPYKLKVELHGLFKVDDTRFSPDNVEDWAEKNAPLVLYPYLREQVYSLTGRAGFTETVLPLFEVPTYRIVPPTNPAKPNE